MKFEAEGQEFSKFLRSLEQFIQKVKSQTNFWQQNDFLTCSRRFLISNKLEQLEFKSEKNYRDSENLDFNVKSYLHSFI